MEPLSVIAAAQGIARFVPGVVRFFRGERAADVAQKLVDTALDITGVNDSRAAEKTLAENVELQIRLQQLMQPVILAELEAETARLIAVNETMRAEYGSDDKFVKRWRPFFGYIVSLTWLAQMLALGWVIIAEPAQAPGVITAMAGLSMMWGVALSVLGISVHKRSQDKQVAAGVAPAGVVPAIMARLKK